MSMQGWSIERRRAEIQSLIAHIADETGISKRQACKVIADRFSVAWETVEGWPSEGKSPPTWHVLQILRYELGLDEIAPLLRSDSKAYRRTKGAALRAVR